MRLDFAVFASHATLQKNGLFSVLDGGLEWISAKSFPAICKDLVLLARFSFDPVECGREWTCSVAVTGPDGSELKPELSITFTPPPNQRHPELPNTFVGLYTYDRFALLSPGLYRFGFNIGEVFVGETTLEAILESR
jgi:hypothetical protein